MNIHEYQAKSLITKFGVAVPRGVAAFTVDEAEAAAKQLGGSVWVVKAQIHAGGRGKAGGVKIAKSLAEVRDYAKALLGLTLVTKQTGPQGRLVRRLYIEEGVDIRRELYLGLLVDRGSSRVTIIASTEGGTEIEEVAAKTPDKIIKVPVDPATGLMPHHARQVAYGLGLEGDQVKSCIKFVTAAWRAFNELDASIVEINPLVVTGKGEVIALDAKMNFDDNGLFRHPDVAALRDENEEDPSEIEAGKYGLNYIKLDGSIGCMVNGAGLAMATMDIIKLYGSAPANFLDVGGGATAEKVTAAFKIITRDRAVKGIFINIFGGIMKCDTIATGVVTAVKEVGLKVPLVVRLEGTNVELGRKILKDSGLNVVAATDMADGAKKIVELAK
jgi:succinyl-CoA synthetase beta subunit